MKKIIIIVMVMMMTVNSANALTLELLDNTDKCSYIPSLDVDYCNSTYLACDVSKVDKKNARFIFKTTDSDYAEQITGLYDISYSIEAVDGCYKIFIEGYKDKFIDVDNVPCIDGTCFYQYAWWNTSLTRYPLISYDNLTNTIFYMNDSYGLDSNGHGKQYIACVPESFEETIYAYNDSVDKWYCANSTTQFVTRVDQGNGSNYGTLDVSLVGWYTMNSTSGQDYSDHNNKMNVGGNPTLTAGKVGNAIDLDGNDYFSVADTPDFDFDEDESLTFMAWYKDDTGTVEGSIFHHNKASVQDNVYFGVGRWGNGYAYIDLHNQTTGSLNIGYKYIKGSVLVDDGNFHHIAGTLDRSTQWMTLYVDGKVDGTPVKHSGRFSPDSVIYIGCDGAGTTCINGFLDDIRIYNRSLSQAEIVAIYNNTKPDNYFITGEFEVYVPPAPVTNVTSRGGVAPYMILKGFNLWELLFESTIKAVIVYVHDIIVTGSMEITGNITQTDGNTTINMIYGSMYGNDIDNTTLPASDMYVPIQNFNGSKSNGFTFVNDNLTAHYNGSYKVSASMSFSGKANDEYHLSLGVDGVMIRECHAERKMGTGGDVGSMAFTCIKSIYENDIISIMVENTISTVPPAIHDININLIRIGND